MVQKNILQLTANEHIDTFEREMQRIEMYGNKSNKAKMLAKCDFVINLLLTVPQNVVLVCEGCRGDDERGFQLANAGSLVECIVKYHLTHKDEIAKEFNAEMVDHKRGCINYEIKASLASNCLATPSDAETTILVNTLGVWSISKHDIYKYTNKQGRLPFNLECGKPFTKLMDAMGYDM